MRRLILSFCLALLATNLYGQTDRATLIGTVTDVTGHPVVSSLVTVIDDATGVSRTTRTNGEGSYTLTALSVGRYSAEFQADSFQTVKVNHFELQVGQTRSVDVHLAAASVTTQVEVISAAAPLNVTSAVIGGVIEGTQVQNLPLNGRNWNSLSALVPGAINSGTGDQGSIRFAGHAQDDNNFRIDGVDATGILNQDQKVSIRLQISTDAIAEFRANSAVYTAESGGTAGGQVDLVSKSGGNNFHGSVFEFIRNDVFDARPFNSTSKLPFRLNQFGGSVGGPIIKDRTFFFFNYEGLRQTLGQSLNGLVPSASYRTQVLATSPALSAILAAYPVGSVATSDPNVLQWFGSGRQLAQENSGFGRIDHKFSDRFTAFGRYVIDDAVTDFPNGGNGGFLQERGYNNVRAQNVAIGSQYILSPRLLTDGRIGFNREYNTSGNESALPYSITVPSFTTLNDQTTKLFADNTFSILDNTTYVLGRHTMKAGAEVRRVQLNNTTNLTPSNTLAYTSEQTFLQNQIAQATLVALVPVTGLRKTMYYGYIQDEFKIRPNLVVNAGVRYEFFNAFHEVNGKERVFDPISCGVQGYCPAGSSYYTPRPNDLGPRLSVAWSPLHFSGKTVVNAGVGTYFGEGQLGDLNAPIANLTSRITLTQANAPGLSYPVAPYIANAPSSSTPRGLDRHRVDGNVNEWTLSVQQQILPETIFQLGYLGSKGTHLFTRTYVNAVNPLTGQRPYPLFGLVDYKSSYVNASFHALQAQLRRNFTRGLLFTANYQWSHAINDGAIGGGESDYAQNVGCQSCERSVSDQDITHVFTASTVWELPFGQGRQYLNSSNRLVTHVVSGWQLSGIGTARTGQPVNITISRPASALPDQNITSPQRPDRVPGAPLYLGNKTAGQWFNPAAFTTPKAGTWGNLGRNAVRGPGLWQFDPALSKQTKLGEGFNIEFRAEFFNIFNRLQLGNPNVNFSSPATFAKITQQSNPGPVGTGTPRQIQFMLRLTH